MRKYSLSNYITITLICLGLSYMIYLFIPADIEYSILLLVCGVSAPILGYLVYDYNRSEYDLLFYNLNIGINGEYPRICRVNGRRVNIDKDGNRRFRFMIPVGLSDATFQNNVTQFEQFSGRRVNINIDYDYSNNTRYLNLTEMQQRIYNR